MLDKWKRKKYWTLCNHWATMSASNAVESHFTLKIIRNFLLCYEPVELCMQWHNRIHAPPTLSSSVSWLDVSKSPVSELSTLIAYVASTAYLHIVSTSSDGCGSCSAHIHPSRNNRRALKHNWIASFASMTSRFHVVLLLTCLQLFYCLSCTMLASEQWNNCKARSRLNIWLVLHNSRQREKEIARLCNF